MFYGELKRNEGAPWVWLERSDRGVQCSPATAGRQGPQGESDSVGALEVWRLTKVPK